jgi:hypothetical protein
VRISTLAAGFALASASGQAGAAEAACMTFWAEARYSVGYDHIVWIANGCESDASCVVWTDVNPSPQPATIPAHRTVGIVTFRGSPASAFIPIVRCAG